MSDTVTHTRGTDSPLNLITGEPPGIVDILNKRAADEAGGVPADRADPPEREPVDDALDSTRDVARLRQENQDYQRQLANAERLRINAERERDEQRERTEDTGLTAITSAIGGLQAEKESLAQQMQAAGDAGDFQKVAEITVRLGEIGAQMSNLAYGKEQAENARQARIERKPDAEERRGGPAIEGATPAERNILAGLRSTSKEAFMQTRTPATQSFLNKHPQFFTDPGLHQKMAGAESMARGEGLAVDSPEYFRFIEETAGVSGTRSETRSQAREREQPNPSAAPSRDAPGPSGRRTAAAGSDVYVSPEQAQVAKWMGVDPVDYAREEQNLRARGDLPYRRR